MVVPPIATGRVIRHNASATNLAAAKRRWPVFSHRVIMSEEFVQ
jgi:hypothetical protein